MQILIIQQQLVHKQIIIIIKNSKFVKKALQYQIRNAKHHNLKDFNKKAKLKMLNLI